MSYRKNFIEKTKNMTSAEMRRMIADGVVSPDAGSRNMDIIDQVITSREREEADALASRTEAREEEILSISRKALTTSRSARIIAISAIILSIIMAIGQIIQWASK